MTSIVYLYKELSLPATGIRRFRFLTTESMFPGQLFFRNKSADLSPTYIEGLLNNGTLIKIEKPIVVFQSEVIGLRPTGDVLTYRVDPERNTHHRQKVGFYDIEEHQFIQEESSV